MSFKSILGDVGKGLKRFFGVAVQVAEVAEPFVDIVFPGVAALYNTTVAAAANAESAAIAAGQQNGTGPQKLAYVINSIQSDFNKYWISLGHTVSPTQTQIEAYVNGVVATLNAIPSVTAVVSDATSKLATPTPAVASVPVTLIPGVPVQQ